MVGSLAERVLSISKMQAELQAISEKMETVRNQIVTINDDQEKLENALAELKGSSVKWLAIFVTAISILVAIYLGIRYDAIYGKIGKLETQIKHLTEQVIADPWLPNNIHGKGGYLSGFLVFACVSVNNRGHPIVLLSSEK